MVGTEAPDVAFQVTPCGNCSDIADYDGFVFEDLAQQTAVACLFCIIGGVGMIGNSLVVLAVSLSRRLQTATNVFVVSLSLSDFLTCLGLPFQAVAVLSDDDGWPLAPALCAMVGGSAILSLTCSVINLATIAVNRCVLITRMHSTYATVFSRRRNIAYAVMTWLFPLFAFVIPQLLGLGKLGFDSSYKLCVWDTSHPLAQIYEILAAIVFFVATTTIAACYITIYVYIRKHASVMHHHEAVNQPGPSLKINQVGPTDHSSVLTEVNTVDNSTFRAPLENKRTVSRKDIDITINLFYIVCIFFLCVIPYGFALLLTNIGVYPVYAGLLLVLNCALNPLIYASKHPNFRDVLKCVVRCNFAAIPDPSYWLRK